MNWFFGGSVNVGFSAFHITFNDVRRDLRAVGCRLVVELLIFLYSFVVVVVVLIYHLAGKTCLLS